jgi:galactokinase
MTNKDATLEGRAPILVEKFVQLYGAEPLVVQAPGRVNLIGEHTDYNEGFVFPAAINFQTRVAIAPRVDRRLVVTSENYSERVALDLERLPAMSRGHWSDYVVGVARLLRDLGGKLSGGNLLIQGDVPQGAGLSSSASLEVAVCRALLESSGQKMEGAALALLCQRAENEFVGARCGIMDQFVAVHGKRGHALLLDCRSLEYRLLPIPENVRLVICNTMVRHSLTGGEYNQRRAECEQAVRHFAERLPMIKALRDVTPEDLKTKGGDLPKVIRKRTLHILTENARVKEAASALERKDATLFGKLMESSHNSLRDDFEVSCKELDLMVEFAQKTEGVYGARMTGGGFGGCTINLVDSSSIEAFRERVGREYQRATGQQPEIYVCSACDGVRRIL